MKNRGLLEQLLGELSAMETLGRVRAEREARRLGDAAPGQAMRRVVDHMAQQEGALRTVCEHLHLHDGAGRSRIGAIAQEIVARAEGMLAHEEKSYRMTLLNLREAIDGVQLLEDVAREASQAELVHFCQEWLKERRELVAHAAHELKWFAENPALALERPGAEILRQLRRGNVAKATKALATMT